MRYRREPVAEGRQKHRARLQRTKLDSPIHLADATLEGCEDWYVPKSEELVEHVNELRRRWTRSKRGLKPEPMKALPTEIPLLAANGNVHDRGAQIYVPEKEEYIDTTGMPELESDGGDGASQENNDPWGCGSGLAPVTDETAVFQVNDEDAKGHGTKSKPQWRQGSAGSVCCFTHPGSINSVPTSAPEGWTRVGVTVDSGVADSIASTDSFPGYVVTPHLNPFFYQSATGEPIVNEGEQVVAMVTSEGTLRGMKFQAAKKITKPLASVKRIV